MKTKNEIYRELQAEWVKLTGLKVGSKVRVAYKGTSDIMGWENHWASSMDALVGQTLEVQAIEDFAITLKGYNFPFVVLEFVSNPIEAVSVRMNSRYTAVVSKDGMKIAGIDLNAEETEKLVNAWANPNGNKSRKFETGQRFFQNDDEYIFACVDYKKYALINVKDGNRWSEPVEATAFGLNFETFNKVADGKRFKDANGVFVSGNQEIPVGDYTAVIYNDKIVVGCQTFYKEQLDLIVEAWKGFQK